MSFPRPHAVIVGAGFAGLWAARTLAGAAMDVTIVDRGNYHTFLPLLYQVAAAELEPEQIAYPVRGVFRGVENIRLVMASVERAEFAEKRLLTTEGPIGYDYLLLGPGSVTNYFGVEGAREHAFGLKSLEEGVALRNHVLSRFERAYVEEDLAVRRRMLTFCVVGGGATGVEYAGALAELIRGPLTRDFPRLEMALSRVVLLEASRTLLPGFPENLQRYAARRLGRMGVEIMFGTAVRRVEPTAVHLDGQVIPADTVVWAAGVRGSPASEIWGLPPGPGGRAEVLPTLQLAAHPEVFVCGDASFPRRGAEPPLPMVAPVAMQQGRQAARNMLRLAAGQGAEPFVYQDKGSMATIGRGAAVVKLGRRTFTGFPAWLVWLFVHLLYLVGFRNRLIVLLSWSIDYFLFERAVRLILPGEHSRCGPGPFASCGPRDRSAEGGQGQDGQAKPRETRPTEPASTVHPESAEPRAHEERPDYAG